MTTGGIETATARFGNFAKQAGQASSTPTKGSAQRGHKPALRRKVGNALRKLAPSFVSGNRSAAKEASRGTSAPIGG